MIYLAFTKDNMANDAIREQGFIGAYKKFYKGETTVKSSKKTLSYMHIIRNMNDGCLFIIWKSLVDVN